MVYIATCIWCRKVQWYNEQWQWQWWKPSYWPQRLEATETAAGFQAKFGHMSPDILVTECLETSAISGQNFALPWQNCLYWWCLIPHNWWITCHIKLSAMDKAMRRPIWNKYLASRRLSFETFQGQLLYSNYKNWRGILIVLHAHLSSNVGKRCVPTYFLWKVVLLLTWCREHILNQGIITSISWSQYFKA